MRAGSTDPHPVVESCAAPMVPRSLGPRRPFARGSGPVRRLTLTLALTSLVERVARPRPPLCVAQVLTRPDIVLGSTSGLHVGLDLILELGQGRRRIG